MLAMEIYVRFAVDECTNIHKYGYRHGLDIHKQEYP